MKNLLLKLDLEKGHVISEFEDDEVQVTLKDLAVLIGLLESIKTKFTEIYLNEVKQKEE